MKHLFTTKVLTMRRLVAVLLALATVTAAEAKTIRMTVKSTKVQTITGFGAACCDGAMCPYGDDTEPVKQLYGSTSKIGLNIMRMEISPSFDGDENVSWSTYNWHGCVPSAMIVKRRGGIVFGTPWSPPGAYKTNGSASGGKVNENDDSDPRNVRGKLREDCYEKFFPWLNSYLAYMKKKGVVVDAVSLQNEPDWWVNYSGCLYDPQELVKLVKNYANQLDRETYNGVKLISGESLGFTQNYTDPLMNDLTCRNEIDIVAGHLYGHAPLEVMKKAVVLAERYNKEVWMTEHSVSFSDTSLPTWHDQLRFAEEVNECMLGGCTAYIYWYMRAHWAFVATGEEKFGKDNKYKNKLLPRAYVMSHFSKYLTGSTRLKTSLDKTDGFEAELEYSAYIKGDSIIVMAIDTTETAHSLKLTLPNKVMSGTHILSTGNEKTNLCQKTDIEIAEPTKVVTVDLPARSLNTYVFMIDDGSTGVTEVKKRPATGTVSYYDLQGRRINGPQGLCIERLPDGTTRKIYAE